MADPNDAYQRSIDFAAKRFAAAVDGYRTLEAELSALSANPIDIQAGGNKEGQYSALQKRLQDASKAWQDAENDYQTALQLQDKARNDAKEFLPAGSTRTRLDTTSGNVLVSVTETADGRGGWSVDPTSVKRVQVAGAQAAGTRISAPTSDKYIVTLQDDGTLKQDTNPNYQPDKSQGPQAVPTSEFIWNPQTGKVENNAAYRPPNADINTTAEYINDPTSPGKFIRNINFKKPADLLTPGQQAVDTATAGTAASKAAADLAKAQTDAATAAQNLTNAQTEARQKPTDAQAQQAVQNALTQQNLAIQSLQQAIAQAGNLNPTAVEQAKATLEQTLQTTQKTKLGDMYGMQDRLKQIRDLLASGDLGDPSNPETHALADQMAAATQRGTTVYDAMKQAQLDRATARTQDVSNKNALANTFGSTFNSGFNTIADMNKYAAIGSSAGADAFVGLMNMAQDRLRSYELPPAQTPDYLGAGSRVGAMANLAASQAAPAPAPSYGGVNIGSGAASNPQPQTPIAPAPVAPEPMNAGGHTITINIGGAGGDSSRGLGGEATGGPSPVAPPAQNGGDMLASAASRGVPATNGEVLKTLFPNAAAHFGLT